MKIFLIRHAHAVDASENPERPLSRRGRGQVRTLARSLETTALLTRRLNLITKIITFPELETEAGITVLAAGLQNAANRLR